jgi:anti-sigma-K factor RskA
MTTPENSEGERARDDVLAGEFVLGVLSSKDHAGVEARMKRDDAFAALVARWQENFASLNDEYELATPPADTYDSIEKRLFSRDSARSDTWLIKLWTSVSLWRLTSLTLLVLLLSYSLFNTGVFAPTRTATPLVAELTGEGAPVGLFARYDIETGRLEMTPVATDAPSQERSLELWLVPGGDAPTISLGVLPQTGDGAIEVPENLRGRLSEGATLAVSLEPMGGSPTGQATGPVIAIGQTRRP